MTTTRAEPSRLEVRRLGRSFAAVQALAEVSFTVARGEIVALLGENGAGKTTLVEIVAGRLRPDHGEVRLDGQTIHAHSPRDVQRRGVAVVHQHFQLVEAFTVEENLRLASAGEISRARWQEVESTLGLQLPNPQARVRELTVGQRQRVEIGKALLYRPSLLLLDEPTAVLTPAETEVLFQDLRQLTANGTAVLLITHRLDEVRAVADRAVVLRGGRLVGTFPGSAPSAQLSTAMVGRIPPQPARPEPPKTSAPIAQLRAVAVPGHLQPTDLDLHAGEIVVLAGVDGNGQSALAERLAGLTDGPGTITVAGRRVDGQHPATLRRLGVWAIPADRRREGVAGGLSVAENLVLGRHRRPPLCSRGLLDPRQVEREAEAVISQLGVVGTPDQMAAELSGGNQQKLAVARVLAGDPRVVAAVHPTRGLDVAAQTAVRSLLIECAARGAAVLVVTADLEEALAIGHRVVVLSRGQIVGSGEPTTPIETLARWIGGEVA